MSADEARAIAKEQQRYWEGQGVTATQAYELLLGRQVWCASWWEVRAEMVRWLLANECRAALVLPEVRAA